MKEDVLDIADLSLDVHRGDPASVRLAPLVAGVSCRVQRGHMTAVVGESGSGKTLTALAAIGLLPAGIRRISGSIRIAGRSCEDLSPRQWRDRRGGTVAMIFQEPMTALDPVFSVEALLREVLALDGLRGREARRQAVALLQEVRIPDPDRCLASAPHMLSGGMRQRVVIALALARNPVLLLADEPTTALDAVTREAVMDLLADLQSTRGLGILMISHDLGLVAERAQRVVVLHGGRMCESGPTDRVLEDARHPYTRGLLGCRLSVDHRSDRLRLVEEVMASPHAWMTIQTLEGPRRPWKPAEGTQASEVPRLVEVAPGHQVATETGPV